MDALVCFQGLESVQHSPGMFIDGDFGYKWCLMSLSWLKQELGFCQVDGESVVHVYSEEFYRWVFDSYKFMLQGAGVICILHYCVLFVVRRQAICRRGRHRCVIEGRNLRCRLETHEALPQSTLVGGSTYPCLRNLLREKVPKGRLDAGVDASFPRVELGWASGMSQSMHGV